MGYIDARQVRLLAEPLVKNRSGNSVGALRAQMASIFDLIPGAMDSPQIMREA